MKDHGATLQRAKCSWKRRFESERIARVRAEQAQEKSRHRLYVYRCPVCKGWHLTKNGQGDHVKKAKK